MKELYVIGIGPGARGAMTFDCYAAIERADVLVGYSKYIELIRPFFPDKPTLNTPMKREVERCRAALRLASEGKRVAIVCSGDAGVYGMAGLVLELLPEYPKVRVEIVPGVTAALSGAAILGAPLGHDFAVISLSDLLTPWTLIEKRLRCAAEGDFCIALYNPGSAKRADYLKKACDILLSCKASETVCGIARHIGRENESCTILPLAELRNASVDMFATVFIGSRETRERMGKMLTPRGYSLD